MAQVRAAAQRPRFVCRLVGTPLPDIAAHVEQAEAVGDARAAIDRRWYPPWFWHVRELTAGDGLSGAAGDEQRLLEALVVAAQETELMELTGEGKRAAMAERGPLADALAALAERAHELGIR